MNRRIVIITWVSASWKTTLQDELLKRWWQRPLNFTTRKPRDVNAFIDLDNDWDFNSKELDEYIFLSKENFFKKMKNWDFLENTNYWWNFYWASTFLPKWNVCIILDPVWRSQVLEYFTRRWIDVETFFIEISQELQEERLIKRLDTEKEILRRKRDFNWFSPTNKCIRLNWRMDTKILANIIEHN